MSVEPTPVPSSVPDARAQDSRVGAPSAAHAVDLVRHRRQITKRQTRKQTTLRIEALATLDPATGAAPAAGGISAPAPAG